MSNFTNAPYHSRIKHAVFLIRDKNKHVKTMLLGWKGDWIVSVMGPAPYYGCIALWTTEAALARELAALLHL